MSGFSHKEKQEYEKWFAEKQAVQRAMPVANESADQKEKRIKELLGSFEKFCKYYLEHYMHSGFGWFHKKAVREVITTDNILLAAEWPREHAKSVLFDVMLPLFLKARNMLTGMMLASANEDKANILLSDIQAELMFNKRFIADFGEQYRDGKWSDGYFVTLDNVGFWAFGRGQSPRGTRNADKRPNYGVADDMDDAAIVKNEQRTDEAVDWILGDFYGAMPTKASWLIVAGNRINKKSILAKIVGDVEENDPKREALVHIKVFALENPKTHLKDLSEKGQPAWKENYTREQILAKIKRQGSRLGMREFFHEHIVIGRVFREEHLPWVKLPGISSYKKLVTYCDPSFKGTKKNDFKAIALVGQYGNYFDIIKVFCRQCLPPEMVRGHYALTEIVPDNMTCANWMESNFIQDTLLKDYDRYGEEVGHQIGIRGDNRKKPDKEARIEALSSFTERLLIRFNIEEKQNFDMIELRNQFLGFPDAEHDDGPDAVEGAIHKLNKRTASKTDHNRTGKYKNNNSRRA